MRSVHSTPTFFSLPNTTAQGALQRINANGLGFLPGERLVPGSLTPSTPPTHNLPLQRANVPSLPIRTTTTLPTPLAFGMTPIVSASAHPCLVAPDMHRVSRKIGIRASLKDSYLSKRRRSSRKSHPPPHQEIGRGVSYRATQQPIMLPPMPTFWKLLYG